MSIASGLAALSAGLIKHRLEALEGTADFERSKFMLPLITIVVEGPMFQKMAEDMEDAAKTE